MKMTKSSHKDSLSFPAFHENFGSTGRVESKELIDVVTEKREAPIQVECVPSHGYPSQDPSVQGRLI